MSGVIHLGILVIGGGTWDGPLSFRKAATFGLSFGLTLINVTFIASYVTRERARTWLVAVFTAACLLETVLVTLQVWRGVPSHFNVETPFDAGIAASLAVGGFTLIAVIVALAIASFRARTTVPPVLRLAIRSGFAALVAAQVSGGLMIATGMRLVFAGNPQRAYMIGGWLKPVHGVLMHGILVLPLLAWLLLQSRWSDDARERAMRAGIAAYVVAVVAAAIVSAIDLSSAI